MKYKEGDIFHLGDKNILYVVEIHNSVLKGRQISNRSKVGLEYWQDEIIIVGNINHEIIDQNKKLAKISTKNYGDDGIGLTSEQIS